MNDLKDKIFIFIKFENLQIYLNNFLGFCPKGYENFSYIDDEICLKFISKKVSYSEAAAQCQADRGDLFKMDTKLKYNILSEYLGRFCSNQKEKYLYSLMTFSHEHDVF